MRAATDTDRWVVMGLAGRRAPWFADVSSWANGSTIPVEFVKCVSAAEVSARLGSGRSYSALLADSGLTSLDRDLIDACREAGTAVLVIGDTGRDWTTLGASAVVPARLDQHQLVDFLRVHATPVSRTPALPEDPPEPQPPWHGRMVAVTGPGGAGSSVLAMAIAQTQAADASNRGMVLLADMAHSADQAMLHDAGTVVPGLQELVESHRREPLGVDRIRQMVFSVEERGYHLLLGLRRPRDWTAIRPRALEASINGLRRAYRVLVADVDCDLQGERETGSVDIEDRNLLARTVIPAADLTVVVGRGDLHGLHSLARTIGLLVEGHVEPDRILVALDRAPRSPRVRASLTGTVARLVETVIDPSAIGNPVFVPSRRDLETALSGGFRLPPALTRDLGREVARRLAHSKDGPELRPDRPEPIEVGSIGHWPDQEDQ